jgi:hypothetical protein
MKRPSPPRNPTTAVPCQKRLANVPFRPHHLHACERMKWAGSRERRIDARVYLPLPLRCRDTVRLPIRLPHVSPEIVAIFSRSGSVTYNFVIALMRYAFCIPVAHLHA